MKTLMSDRGDSCSPKTILFARQDIKAVKDLSIKAFEICMRCAMC